MSNKKDYKLKFIRFFSTDYHRSITTRDSIICRHANIFIDSKIRNALGADFLCDEGPPYEIEINLLELKQYIVKEYCRGDLWNYNIFFEIDNFLFFKKIKLTNSMQMIVNRLYLKGYDVYLCIDKNKFKRSGVTKKEYPIIKLRSRPGNYL